MKNVVGAVNSIHLGKDSGIVVLPHHFMDDFQSSLKFLAAIWLLLPCMSRVEVNFLAQQQTRNTVSKVLRRARVWEKARAGTCLSISTTEYHWTTIQCPGAVFKIRHCCRWKKLQGANENSDNIPNPSLQLLSYWSCEIGDNSWIGEQSKINAT